MDPLNHSAPDPGFHFRPKGSKFELEVTDPTLLKKSRRKEFSASSAKALSAKSCAVKWFFDKVTPSEEDPFSAGAIGGAAHLVFDDFYGLAPAERTRQKYTQMIADAADAKWGDQIADSGVGKAAVRMAKAKWTAEVHAAADKLFEIEEPSDVEIIARERKYQAQIEGIPTVGYIDREVRLPDGEVSIEDYKSSKKVPNLYYGDEHGDQIRLYVVMKELVDGIRVKRGRILYTRVGVLREGADAEVAKGEIDLSDVAIDKTVSEFKASWKRHNKFHDAGVFPTKVSALCGWCPLVQLCPSAAAEGKQAADGVQVISPEQLTIRVVDPIQDDPAPPAVMDDLPPIPDDLYAEQMAEYEQPEAIRSQESNAHSATDREDTEPSPTKENTSMKKITEGKPWDGGVLSDGTLDPASYASAGLFGFQTKAVEVLREANGPDQSVAAEDIRSLLDTFNWIVAEAQESWTGHRDPNHGAATRMRGVLYSLLERSAPPINEGAEAMSEWAYNAVAVCEASTAMVREAFLSIPGSDDSPWLDLYPEDEDGEEDYEDDADAA